MWADMLTKEMELPSDLEDVILKNDMVLPLPLVNEVRAIGTERKSLRLTVTDLKEKLLDGEIYSYSWLPTNSMWTDMLAKEMEITSDLENVILKNDMVLPLPLVNEVKAIGTENRQNNIRNR